MSGKMGVRWRVQCRRKSVVFQETSGPGFAVDGRAAFERLAKQYERTVDTNVELQERPAGKRRYRPIEQAVGRERIAW